MRGQCRFPGSAIAVPQSVTPTPNRYGRGPPSSAPRGSPREGRRSGQPSHRNTWQLLLPHEQVDGRKRYAGTQVKHFTPHAHTYVLRLRSQKGHRSQGGHRSQRVRAASRGGLYIQGPSTLQAPRSLATRLASFESPQGRRQAARPPRWLNARSPGNDLKKGSNKSELVGMNLSGS